MEKYYKATTLKKKSQYNSIFPGFQEGEIYEEEGAPIMCQKGFHFTKDPLVVLRFYSMNDLFLWEVEPLGEIKGDPKEKLVTNKIRMIKILSFEEAQELLTGTLNTYREDDTLEAVKSYKDGFPDGVFKYYWWDGKTLQTEITFKNGVQDGPYRNYRPDGTVFWETVYKDGAQHIESFKG